MTTIIFALLAAFVVWKLRSVLGIRTVDFVQGRELLAITDQPLATS